MARQQIYTVKGTDLVFHAHGYDSVFHSKRAAEAHAADSGAEPVYVGDVSKVPTGDDDAQEAPKGKRGKR